MLQALPETPPMYIVSCSVVRDTERRLTRDVALSTLSSIVFRRKDTVGYVI